MVRERASGKGRGPGLCGPRQACLEAVTAVSYTSAIQGNLPPRTAIQGRISPQVASGSLFCSQVAGYDKGFEADEIEEADVDELMLKMQARVLKVRVDLQIWGGRSRC